MYDIGGKVYIWELPMSRRHFKVIRLNDNAKEEKCETRSLGTLEGYKDEEKLVQVTAGSNQGDGRRPKRQC